MRNKGFTLVELITVITLLGLIGLISIPIVDTSIKKSKEKLYNSQIKEIIKQSKTYITENSFDLQEDEFTICVSTLIKEGYFETTEIINPINKNKMEGKVVVTYNEETKTYLYEYEDIAINC